ncbi:MAG: hypothetical protein KBD46_02865 [Candidatus Levybacteria bacterium]|nr:hypothetical protein [Candidatus Levybacteria bacterium]
MKTLTTLLFAFFLSFFLFPSKAYAVVNPLDAPNNKVGIHILFPAELEESAKLVNSNGGEWGYVIIPIQSGDKDLVKWQKFMDDAKRLKIIPIIRIATEGDYFNTKVWRKPQEADVLDFANFLNSLQWPTQNRFIAIFNETNRADEWGGEVRPDEYAKLVSYAVTVFKSKSQDFFMIAGGFDNASANTNESMNPYDYMRAMHAAVPGIFLQIDGWSSHSYPNPAFAQPPTKLDTMSIASFRHELQLIQSLGGKNLPIFITETGWSTERVSPAVISDYMHTAFTSVWSDANVVAVTPFLLKAGSPFHMFSFIKDDNSYSEQYNVMNKLPKVKGKPQLAPSVLGRKMPEKEIKEKTFEDKKADIDFTIPPSAKIALKWFLQMPI